MELETRTPANSAVVLVDYVTGYANLIRSQPLNENITGAVALARMAIGYKMPLVVSIGPEQDPRGGLYPEVSQEIGDHPIIHRGGTFDAFGHPEFEQAIEATGVKHLILGGLATEGCIQSTALSALRKGYGVSIVADAVAGLTQVAHDTAMTRLVSVGVTPLTWLALASELQVSYDNVETVDVFLAVQALSSSFTMNAATMENVSRISRGER
ncbi:isochorismatase family protein [Streptomyces sp. NPDC059597]|uniref:isochorismatase family protein n=1 Tax=Streptomyces sp. NPDC059597 TaxID=3346879 RepID=UPI0036795D73